MAVVRFPVAKYATIELNHVSFPETARVMAQLPLSPTNYPAANTKLCENGAWLVYDMATGVARFPTSTSEVVGLVYNAEKEYDQFNVGMNQYAMKSGMVPRIGMPMVGDTYTTNLFQYEEGTDLNTDEKVDAVIGAFATTPVYLVVTPNSDTPTLTTTIGSGLTVAQVVKYYTLPNGEKAVKVQFIKVAG